MSKPSPTAKLAIPALIGGRIPEEHPLPEGFDPTLHRAALANGNLKPAAIEDFERRIAELLAQKAARGPV